MEINDALQLLLVAPSHFSDEVINDPFLSIIDIQVKDIRVFFNPLIDDKVFIFFPLCFIKM